MRKNRFVLIVLLVVISVMAVAYAIFATDLKLNGEAEIVGEWNIKITGIDVQDLSEGCNPGDPTFTDTTASFSAELQKPSDKITYVITIENLGTIDAVLNNVTFTPDDKNDSPAIIYTTVNPSDTLNAGEKTTCIITVMYDENYEEVPSIKSKDITGIIEYVQK